MGLIQLYSTPKLTSRPGNISLGYRAYRDLSIPNDSRDTHKQLRRRKSSTFQQSETGEGHYFDSLSSDMLGHTIKEKEHRDCRETLTNVRFGAICQNIDWLWDEKSVQHQTIVDSSTILFHPHYSQGTSVVRSNQSLVQNMIHYWEIEVTHWFSGTDLVI